MKLIAIHRNKCAALQHAGPFTVWIPAWRPGSPMTYSTSDPHFVSWNGFWLNAADPVGGYSDAIDTMMEFEECQQQAQQPTAEPPAGEVNAVMRFYGSLSAAPMA